MREYDLPRANSGNECRGRMLKPFAIGFIVGAGVVLFFPAIRFVVSWLALVVLIGILTASIVLIGRLGLPQGSVRQAMAELRLWVSDWIDVLMGWFS